MHETEVFHITIINHSSRQVNIASTFDTINQNSDFGLGQTYKI